jgi:hypothetical protein
MKTKNQNRPQMGSFDNTEALHQNHRTTNKQPVGGGVSASENRPEVARCVLRDAQRATLRGSAHHNAQLQRNPESAKSVLALAEQVLKRNQPRNSGATNELHTPPKSTPKSCTVSEGRNSQKNGATDHHLHEVFDTRPEVTCAACLNYAPNRLNPSAGLGRCRFREPSPLPWPNALRRCWDFKPRDRRI